MYPIGNKPKRVSMHIAADHIVRCILSMIALLTSSAGILVYLPVLGKLGPIVCP